MTATITAPWLDPLTLIDAMARLVIEPDVPGLMMYAVSPAVFASANPLVIYKGAPRADWLANALHPTYASEANHADDPVVTLVPHVERLAPAGDDGWYLWWRPLRFSQLPRWLEKLELMGLDPAGDNAAALAAIRRQMTGARAETSLEENIPDMVEHRAQRTTWINFLDAIMHPDRNPGFTAEDALSLTPKAMGTALRVDITARRVFHPYATRSNGVYVMGEGWSTTRGARERDAWRRVHYHGYKPAATFFGKRWMADHSTPDALFAGVEMEMELPTPTARTRMISALYSAADELGRNAGSQERLHVEQDGSIHGHGIEVVLMPHEVHSSHAEAFWRKMWDTSIAHGASNAHRSCGMHVHISAGPALKMPAGVDRLWPGAYRPDETDFHTTTAFLIDLVTGMLAGGPTMWAMGLPPSNGPISTVYPRNARSRSTPLITYDQSKPRFATSIFGRHANWDGGYAVVCLDLMRKSSHLQIDRYRHVNWNNSETIEFRLFGPQQFAREVNDWVNVATQLSAAIVHFSRTVSLFVLKKGCEVGNGGATAYLASLPSWLSTMLRSTANGHAAELGLAIQPSGLYAIEPPSPSEWRSQHHPWRPGLRCRSSNDSLFHEARGVRTEISGNSLTTHRRQELAAYAACITLWRRFLAFLERQAPQYDLLQRHLEEHLQLPDQQQLQSALVGQGAPCAQADEPELMLESIATQGSRPAAAR